jgi:hypothetical protein
VAFLENMNFKNVRFFFGEGKAIHIYIQHMAEVFRDALPLYLELRNRV